jgi:hypothetical protein
MIAAKFQISPNQLCLANKTTAINASWSVYRFLVRRGKRLVGTSVFGFGSGLACCCCLRRLETLVAFIFFVSIEAMLRLRTAFMLDSFFVGRAAFAEVEVVFDLVLAVLVLCAALAFGAGASFATITLRVLKFATFTLLLTLATSASWGVVEPFLVGAGAFESLMVGVFAEIESTDV